MWTRQRKNTQYGRLIVPCLAAVFLSYFGFHSVNGAFGLNSKMNLERRAMELRVQLDELNEERESLQRQVYLLDRVTLDKDLLDERARALLNVSRADEIVIYR
jgi:cell division protein FtsB